VCDCPCDIVLVELKFIVCGPDPKICIYTDNVCNQKVFQILFSQFVWEAKYEKSVHSWWKKSVVLNTVSLKTYCTSCNSFFPVWHFLPRFTCSLYLLVQDLRCSQWWGFILQSGLGHPVVWYMVMNILEDGKTMFWPKPRYPLIRLHGPITRKIILISLCIFTDY
jgi:hypothetical protein